METERVKERKREWKREGMAGRERGRENHLCSASSHSQVKEREPGWIWHDGSSVLRRHIGVRRYPIQPLNTSSQTFTKWRVVIVNSVKTNVWIKAALLLVHWHSHCGSLPLSCNRVWQRQCSGRAGCMAVWLARLRIGFTIFYGMQLT